MIAFLAMVAAVLAWQLAVILVTMAVTRVSDVLTRAPALDVVLGLLTWIPWVAMGWWYGWAGFIAAVLGEFLSLQAFAILHAKATGYRGPEIRKALDGFVGPLRNHLGLWITIPALPIFLAIRLGQLAVYPFLVHVLDFPRYRMAEWVNVSRQKFDGLIGHDLIWCLYCDWMTGVYSLGAEMLRNVESFWCPIKFYEGKKCENCRIDFPDVDEWVPADGRMSDVVELLESKYSPEEGTPRSWFGHPERTPAPGTDKT